MDNASWTSSSLPVLHLWYHPFRIPPSDTCMPVGPLATDEKKTFFTVTFNISIYAKKKKKREIEH